VNLTALSMVNSLLFTIDEHFKFTSSFTIIDRKKFKSEVDQREQIYRRGNSPQVNVGQRTKKVEKLTTKQVHHKLFTTAKFTAGKLTTKNSP
jgi:hypothetical protein